MPQRWLPEQLSNLSPSLGTLAALRASSESTHPFPSFRGDLLPYADADDAYWVGFYGTRPAYKRLVREASAAVHQAEALVMLAHAAVAGQSGGESRRAETWGRLDETWSVLSAGWPAAIERGRR